MKKTIIYFFFSLLIIVFLSVSMFKQHRDLVGFRNNQAVLLGSIHKYQAKDSINIAEINKLTLTLKEYKQYRQEDAKLIAQIKGAKPQQVTSIQAQSTYEVATILHDSVIIHDTIYLDTIKAFNYSTKWHTIAGQIHNDSVELSITNHEELLVTISKVKKKAWFINLPIWLFGSKTDKVSVISKNPNTQIQNIEFIELK